MTLPPPDSMSPAVVESLLKDARRLLRNGLVQEAFTITIGLKRSQSPIQGLDFIRAGCFIEMGRSSDAQESLREELRYFPSNVEARKLLGSLMVEVPDTVAWSRRDPEFSQVLEIVRPYTMLSVERLYSLFAQARRVCEENVPGNFVECGVAAGGSSALLAWVVRRYSKVPRFVWCFDSFSGMPPAGEHDRHEGVPADETGWGTGTCAASQASLQEVCAKLGVGDVIRPVPGLFEDTLPVTRNWVGMVALLHLDGDWYSSTRAILENLFDRVSEQGVFQVDDFGYWEGCRKACLEFFQDRGFAPALQRVDDTGVWFNKPEKFPVNQAVPVPLQEAFSQLDVSQFGVESQMSRNERFQLFWLLATQLRLDERQKRSVFVEVGSYAGASLLQSFMALKLHRRPVIAFAVEPEGQLQFFEVLRELAEEGRHIPMMSDAAAPVIARECSALGQQPDAILIDGDHSYEGVKRDLELYFPLLRPGGILIVHDYLPALSDENRDYILFHHKGNEPGIRRACEEFFASGNAEPVEAPLLHPTDPTQTQAWLPVIPGVFSTLRAWRKR